MNTEVLERATQLREKLEQKQQEQLESKIRYEQYCKRLAELDLTPETVDAERERLQNELQEVEARLIPQLDEIERLLQ